MWKSACKILVSEDETDCGGLSQSSSWKEDSVPGSIDYIQINSINDWQCISTHSKIIILFASTISSKKLSWTALLRLSQIIFPQHKTTSCMAAPAHRQFNQFTQPIFIQTFQYWEGQGCYSHLIKSEYSVISESIAVSIHILKGNREWIDVVPLPYKTWFTDTERYVWTPVKIPFPWTNYSELSFKLLLWIQSSLQTTMSSRPKDDL